MMFKVSEFCRFAQQPATLKRLFGKLRENTSRNMTDNEVKELSESYPQVARMLTLAQKIEPSFGDVNITMSNLLLEYRLPGAPAWCDLVLIGRDKNDRQNVMIVELKNWRSNSKDLPGDYTGLIRHDGRNTLHPSRQVQRYTEYCQRFHSAVIEAKASVEGCVYFTKDINLSPYQEGVNETLVKEFPVSNTTEKSTKKLAETVLKHISKPDIQFADYFVNGIYKQDRNILLQSADNMTNYRANNRNIIDPFVLVSEQDEDYLKIFAKISKLKDNEKLVFVVDGSAGSGKSAIATSVLVEAMKKFNNRGNIVFVTPTSSQRDNWIASFEKAGGSKSIGIIRTANSYNPGMTSALAKKELYPYFSTLDNGKYIKDKNTRALKFEYFRDYLKYMEENNLCKDYMPNHHFMSIVDEAHALINTAVKGYSSNKSGGWCYQMGAQAYHIINESRVTIFFLDSKQSFRDNETTTIDDIKAYAEDLGAEYVYLKLPDSIQFRCGGNPNVSNWVDSMFTSEPLKNYDKWKDDFDIHFVDSPDKLDKWLRSKKTTSIRILSSYSREWKSRSTKLAGIIPGYQMLNAMHTTNTPYDFELKNKDGSVYKKYWNNPESYDIFVQARVGSKMHDDPLCEVGCPYSVRGFDYQYIGVLWLEDLIWRKGRWAVDLDYNEETQTGSSKNAAKKELKAYCKQHRNASDHLIFRDKESDMKACQHLIDTVVEAYMIVLKRGIKGMALYIKDEETRKHVKSLLNANS